MNHLKKTISLWVIFSFILTPLTWAAEGYEEQEALRQEIRVLKEKLWDLERRLQKTEAKVQEAPPMVSEARDGVHLPNILEDITINGFVDASYVYNFEQPGTRANALRAFDVESNSFTPHMFQLSFEKAVTEDSPIGFRADLAFGEDAEAIGSAGLGSTADEFDLMQAYVATELPVGNGIGVHFGKFTTLLGGEVIESKDNWNFSRSFLFFYAIPFTHTGVRFTYPLSDTLGFTLGLNNGWDIVDENNNGKSIESQIAWAPADNFSITVSNIVGPEQADDSDDMRTVTDVIIAWDATEKLSFMLNGDFGWEENLIVPTPGTEDDTNWWGGAAYGRYQLTDWWAIAVRGEFFRDRDGIRTGSVASPTIQDLWEVTATNEFNLYKDVIARLEYRHDKSDAKSFKNGEESYQNTVAVEFIYPF